MKPGNLHSALVAVLLLFGGLILAEHDMTQDEAERLAADIIIKCGHEVDISKQETLNLFPETSSAIGNMTDKMKQFMLCFYKKLELIDATGKPDVEGFTLYLENRFPAKKHKVKPTLAKCLEGQNADTFEAMGKIDICLIKNILE